MVNSVKNNLGATIKTSIIFLESVKTFDEKYAWIKTTYGELVRQKNDH